jgi:hypothetical protein
MWLFSGLNALLFAICNDIVRLRSVFHCFPEFLGFVGFSDFSDFFGFSGFWVSVYVQL